MEESAEDRKNREEFEDRMARNKILYTGPITGFVAFGSTPRMLNQVIRLRDLEEKEAQPTAAQSPPPK